MSDTISTPMPSKVKMNQPYKILIDIWGVITSWKCIEVLKLYVRENISDFLEKNWNNDRIKDFTTKLRKQTVEDQQEYPDLPSIVESDENNKSQVIQSVIDCIDWRERHHLKTYSNDTNLLYDSIWSEGYRTGDLIVHAFDDVLPSLRKWTSEEFGIKIYTFASGSPKKQRLFLSSTTSGDLNEYITNGIDSFHIKYDSNKFRQIFSALLERHPQNILYITDSPKKSRAALTAQLRSVLVLRAGNKQYADEKLEGLQLIESLDDLQFINNS